MEISYEQWKSVSNYFATLTLERLNVAAEKLHPNPEVELRPVRFDESVLMQVYTRSMAEALLSVVDVLRPIESDK